MKNSYKLLRIEKYYFYKQVIKTTILFNNLMCLFFINILFLSSLLTIVLFVFIFLQNLVNLFIIVFKNYKI